jgi:hypothetical protein
MILEHVILLMIISLDILTFLIKHNIYQTINKNNNITKRSIYKTERREYNWKRKHRID